MKVKIKRIWQDGQMGYELGDALHITDKIIAYQTLHGLKETHLSNIITIYPNEGYYSDPSTSIKNSPNWKKIPKRKIITKTRKI